MIVYFTCISWTPVTKEVQLRQVSLNRFYFIRCSDMIYKNVVAMWLKLVLSNYQSMMEVTNLCCWEAHSHTIFLSMIFRIGHTKAKWLTKHMTGSLYRCHANCDIFQDTISTEKICIILHLCVYNIYEKDKNF